VKSQGSADKGDVKSKKWGRKDTPYKQQKKDLRPGDEDRICETQRAWSRGQVQGWSCLGGLAEIRTREKGEGERRAGHCGKEGPPTKSKAGWRMKIIKRRGGSGFSAKKTAVPRGQRWEPCVRAELSTELVCSFAGRPPQAWAQCRGRKLSPQKTVEPPQKEAVLALTSAVE